MFTYFINFFFTRLKLKFYDRQSLKKKTNADYNDQNNNTRNEREELSFAARTFQNGASRKANARRKPAEKSTQRVSQAVR